MKYEPTGKQSFIMALALFATLLVLGFLLFAGLHGKYRDAIAGKLHDDCVMCNIYRFMHSNNAAFATREAKRNNRR